MTQSKRRHYAVHRRICPIADNGRTLWPIARVFATPECLKKLSFGAGSEVTDQNDVMIGVVCMVQLEETTTPKGFRGKQVVVWQPRSSAEEVATYVLTELNRTKSAGGHMSAEERMILDKNVNLQTAENGCRVLIRKLKDPQERAMLLAASWYNSWDIAVYGINEAQKVYDGDIAPTTAGQAPKERFPPEGKRFASAVTPATTEASLKDMMDKSRASQE